MKEKHDKTMLKAETKATMLRQQENAGQEKSKQAFRGCYSKHDQDPNMNTMNTEVDHGQDEQ